MEKSTKRVLEKVNVKKWIFLNFKQRTYFDNYKEKCFKKQKLQLDKIMKELTILYEFHTKLYDL